MFFRSRRGAVRRVVAERADKIWGNSYAASSTTVAKKNSVLLSLEMTTTGSRGVSSSSSLLPEAVLVGSSIPGATRAAAPSAVSANLATEYPLRDLSQKPLRKASTPIMHTCLFPGHRSALKSAKQRVSTMRIYKATAIFFHGINQVVEGDQVWMLVPYTREMSQSTETSIFNLLRKTISLCSITHGFIIINIKQNFSPHN